jgi:hypothetical protein
MPEPFDLTYWTSSRLECLDCGYAAIAVHVVDGPDLQCDHCLGTNTVRLHPEHPDGPPPLTLEVE